MGGNYVFQVAATGPNGFEIGRSNLSPPVVAGGGWPGAAWPGAPGGFGMVSASSSTVIASQSFVPAAFGTQLTVTVRDQTGRGLAGKL